MDEGFGYSQNYLSNGHTTRHGYDIMGESTDGSVEICKSAII